MLFDHFLLLVSGYFLGGVVQPPTSLICPEEDSLRHDDIQDALESCLHGLVSN